MEIDIAQERFVAHGLVILARNYLDVYPYDRWSDKVMHHGDSQTLWASGAGRQSWSRPRAIARPGSVFC